MKSFHTTVITIVLLLCLINIPRALAIYCYVCTSNLDLNCHDPFIGSPYEGNHNNFYGSNYGDNVRNDWGENTRNNWADTRTSWGSSSSLVNCDDRNPVGYANRFAGGRSACMKQKIKEDGRTVITRSCVYTPLNIGDCSRSPTYSNNRGYLDFCEICDEHGCNSGIKLSSIIIFPIVLSILSSFFIKTLWNV